MFPKLTTADFNTGVTIVVGICIVFLLVWVFDKKGPKSWQ